MNGPGGRMARDVLVVDDDASVLEAVAGALEDEGHTVRTGSSSKEAFERLRERVPQIVLLDLHLGPDDPGGMDCLGVLVERYPHLPVVMFSGEGPVGAADAAVRAGAYDYLEKPFGGERLLATIERAVDAARNRSERLAHRRREGKCLATLGPSKAVADLASQIDRVAPSNVRLLLKGPPGAGRTSIARKVHERSLRSSGPFEALHVASMPVARIASELFGDERGGDVPKSVGVLERAHGGTLFLDEIASLPFEVQIELTRTLAVGRIRRVGGSAPVRIDTRLIASTSCDLALMIREDAFSQDLYNRVAVTELDVPTLDRRIDDIPMLMEEIAIRSSRENGLPIPRFDEATVALFQSHDWVGDLVQLRWVIEQVVVESAGRVETVRVDDLPDVVRGMFPNASIENGRDVLSMPMREARETFEREYLVAQLNLHDWKIARVARVIGMERSALHRKMRALGISAKGKQKPQEPPSDAVRDHEAMPA